MLGVKKSPSVLGGTTFRKGGLYLEVSALGTEPFLDEVLGVSAKAKHEVPLGLQLVDGLNSLMDLEKRCKCQIVLQPWRLLLDLGPEVPVLSVLCGNDRSAYPHSGLSGCGDKGLTLTSREAISCWLVVEARKLLIWAFNGSSTSTSMS